MKWNSRTGSLLLVATVAIAAVAAGATAIASPAATEEISTQGLAGQGIGLISCNRWEERCFASSPFSLAISAVGNNGLFSLCDVHNSTCIHGPLWTVANDFDCWSVVPSEEAPRVSGGATLYAGKWFTEETDEGFMKSWWIFKVIDRGLEGVDQVGMRKSPRLGVHTRNDDGACGARDLWTSPLIAGDFKSLDSIRR